MLLLIYAQQVCPREWLNLFKNIILCNSLNIKQGCKKDFTKYWTLGQALAEYRSLGQVPPSNECVTFSGKRKKGGNGNKK
jgi:hypothetical protein